MTPAFFLTRDFASAAAQFREQMDTLRNHLELPFLNDVPPYIAEDWYDGDDNNCANFAFHRNTGDLLQPGDITGAECRSMLNIDMHKAFLGDGAVYLGASFLNCPSGHAPAALFFEDDESGEYHFMALKYMPGAEGFFWAEKAGNLDAETLDAEESIFDAAIRHAEKFPVFAGYYAMPATLRR